MPFCNQCGTEVAEGVRFCSKCGAPMQAASSTPGAAPSPGAPAAAPAPQQPAAAPAASSSVDNDKLMGALSYLLITAVLFLIMEPYKNSRFIRFHSFQAIFFAVGAFALQIALSVIGFILGMAGIGFLFAMLMPFISLGLFVLWIFVVFRAYQGEEYRLPVIGDLAAKQV